MMGKMPRLYCPTLPKHDQIEFPSIALRHIWWFLTDDALANFSFCLDGVQAVALVDRGCGLRMVGLLSGNAASESLDTLSLFFKFGN